MIAPKTATVYRVTIGKHTKRFFSKRAAARWLAEQLIHQHCYCDDVFPDLCHYHDARNVEITTRLVRFIQHMPEEGTP